MDTPFSPALLTALREDYARNPRKLFIANEFVDAASGEAFDVSDPATGDTFAVAASGGPEDIDRAVRAAKAALPLWSVTPPAARADILLKLAELIEANAERIALTETLDNGMPYVLAKFGGVLGAVSGLKYNAGWATKIAGETLTPSVPGEWHAFTLREPVGVVGSIVPWNFPFVMAVSKIAPALAAGCTVVLKPAEQTPLTAVILGELLRDAGLPEGVVNIVTGFGETAGAALAAHPLVDKVSFTGSTTVGKSIIRASTHNLKRVSLELGGKSPTVIFADADLDKAIPGAAAGIFNNAGQVCAAGSRLFVHEAVADRVIEGVVERARTLKIGSGLEPGTEMGPLVSREQLERVLGFISHGASDGATVAVGGESIDRRGYFIQPTVLTGTAAGMKVVEEEIFGPVLCVMRFGDGEIDAIAEEANATQYGLSSAIWTRDISNALRLAKRLKAGTVRINGGAGVDSVMPLGGYKQSGWGRENGSAGIEAYTEIKAVTVAL